jgi:rRNA maturation endonuclease Nob1
MTESTSSATHADPMTTLRLAAVRRRRESISLAALALAVILVVVVQFAVLGVRQTLPVRAMLALLGGALVQAVFSTWNARCPACNKHIRGGIGSAHFCPQCGVRLRSTGDINV